MDNNTKKGLYTNSKKGKRGKAELTNAIGFRINHMQYKAIKDYCKLHKIPKSNLYRHCLIAGFEALTKEDTNEE